MSSLQSELTRLSLVKKSKPLDDHVYNNDQLIPDRATQERLELERALLEKMSKNRRKKILRKLGIQVRAKGDIEEETILNKSLDNKDLTEYRAKFGVSHSLDAPKEAPIKYYRVATKTQTTKRFATN